MDEAGHKALGEIEGDAQQAEEVMLKRSYSLLDQRDGENKSSAEQSSSRTSNISDLNLEIKDIIDDLSNSNESEILSDEESVDDVRRHTVAMPPPQ